MPRSSTQASNSSIANRRRLGYQSLPSLVETASTISLPRSENSIPTRAGAAASVQAPANAVDQDIPSTSDIIIAVMGPTGAGKTTFISQARGMDEDELVGHGLRSCTQHVTAFTCNNSERTRRIVLVDTPGFDDTNLSDLDILKRIADWLKETYENDVKLSGLLYLHRISDNRMAGTPLRLLNTFKQICGDEVLKYVLLVTTMWDDVEQEVGCARESDLCKKYWKTMIAQGSRTVRFHNSCASAWDILSQFDDAPRQILRLQHELVDQGLPLSETAAGKSLFSSLLDFIKKMVKLLRKIQAKMEKSKLLSVRTPLQKQHDEVAATKDAAEEVRRRYDSSTTITPILRSGTESSPSVTPNARDPVFNEIPMVRSPTSSSTSSDSVSSPVSSLGESVLEPEQQKHILQGTVKALELLDKIIGLTPSPTFRPVIRLVLSIVKSIEQLQPIDDSLVYVAENSTHLMVNLVGNAGVGDINEKLKPHIRGVEQELYRIRDIIRTISSHKMANRIFLADADKEVVAGCERQIARACEAFGTQIGLINHQLILHLQAAVGELTTNRTAVEQASRAGKQTAAQTRRATT
ncbi:hypothetical protein NLJ89_g3077 [Agrocybe chaxingu]|uniref:G domain-containing protein n=1 Tax=Agrocybe chaxingu TaxID=84603 RepID=A0A9W8K351_9AGAR|nr:hypothetical protein NLJ89_g3077 [Agrocybe chaxingu]